MEFEDKLEELVDLIMDSGNDKLKSVCSSFLVSFKDEMKNYYKLLEMLDKLPEIPVPEIEKPAHENELESYTFKRIKK